MDLYSSVSSGIDPVVEIEPFTPVRIRIPTSSVDPDSNEDVYFNLIGVVSTSDVFKLFDALLISYQSSLTLTNASLVKSFTRGLDILPTAKSSLFVLYSPIVVKYVCGLFIKVEKTKSPDPEINVGFVE